MTRAVEDDPKRDPGFEHCSDEDCGGTLRTNARGEVVCKHCGKAQDDSAEEIGGEGGDE